MSNSRALPVLEQPDVAKLGAWSQLVRAYHLIARRIFLLLADEDLTLPQFDVLATLHHGEGLTQQELAQRLLVTKGNICNLLDRMEGLGWVERRTDRGDARINRLHLKPAGRRKIRGVLPRVHAEVLLAFRDVSWADLKSLRAVLEQLDRQNQDGR